MTPLRAWLSDVRAEVQAPALRDSIERAIDSLLAQRRDSMVIAANLEEHEARRREAEQLALARQRLDEQTQSVDEGPADAG